MACPASLRRPGGGAQTGLLAGPLAEIAIGAAMVASLLAGTLLALARLLLDLPLALLAAARTALSGGTPPRPDHPASVRYYTGTVRHTRRKPVKHGFR